MSFCQWQKTHIVYRAPFIFIFTLIIICFLTYILYDHFHRVKHTGVNLEKRSFQCYSTTADSFRETLLRPLLIERVSGTIGNTQARQHILSKLHSTNLWDIELDTFDSMTPDGQVEFTNIVATLDPTATRRLVLACHYDSKKLPKFIGATDSAVPCAMLLDLAINLQDKLRDLKQKKGNPTLQLIFFDGEEAVRDWSATDSIYGSRHLATKMRHRNVPGQENLNEIDAMDIFVLLDLIGHRDIRFNNFYDRTTGRIYNRLRDIETELIRSYKLNNNQNAFKQTAFTSAPSYGHIEDDHIPFLHYDVPILHLISVPFPPTWHTINDNEANLDFPTINHVRNIMKIFVIEYLHLKQQIC